LAGKASHAYFFFDGHNDAVQGTQSLAARQAVHGSVSGLKRALVVEV
jgi:hypothetical protein